MSVIFFQKKENKWFNFTTFLITLFCFKILPGNALLISPVDNSQSMIPEGNLDNLPNLGTEQNILFSLSSESIPQSELPEFFQMPYTNIGVIDKVLGEVTNYFINLRDPNSGLFVDAGSAEDPLVDLGISSTGYGLTALTLATEYGLIDKNQARQWVEQALNTLLDIQNRQFEYESDLVHYLEQKAQDMEPGATKERIIKGLEEKGWKRFRALEELRDMFEVDFLKEKRGKSREYSVMLKEYKRKHGIQGDLSPEQLNDFHNYFLRMYSDIYKYGRWGFFYRYLERIPPPAHSLIERVENPPPSRSVKEGLNDLSTSDTAILLAGVLTSGYYFGGKVQRLAEQIYKNVEWNMMINNPGNTGLGAGEHPDVISMGWVPEGIPGHPAAGNKGFLEGRWDTYTDETLLIVLLALGAPAPTADSISSLIFGEIPKELGKELYYKFKRIKGAVGGMPESILSIQGGLWTYYMNIWLDTHNKIDQENLNWYQNSTKATLANRNIVLNMKDVEGKTLAERYKTFNEHLWPITTMLTPLRRRSGEEYRAGYRMDIGVVRPTISPQELGKIPPLVAPNGYAGSIIHSLYSYLGLRYLASTEKFIWGKGGFYDAFSYDIGEGEVPGQEWFATTRVAYSQGQFLQMFNLLGSVSGKKTIWDITNEIPYFQKAFEKAGLKEIPVFDSMPEELIDGMREEVAGEIRELDQLIDRSNREEILNKFEEIMNNYLRKGGSLVGEYDELVRILKEKISKDLTNPLLYYMLAETRMAEIRDISLAATGEKYINEGDYYKTFEALKYYFKHADDYYKEARTAISRSLLYLSEESPDPTSYLLKTKATALDFILTKNSFYNYNEQKELFKETAGLIHNPDKPAGIEPDTLVSEIANMIYLYDYEAELSGALSKEQILQDLLYWEDNYDFSHVRTPVYPRLESVYIGD